MSDEIPVALFAYRRPDLLAGTIESLRRNKVPLIYAFSDGAANESVASDVAQVREMIRAISWGRVELHASEKNLGVTGAIIGGVDHVLARHAMVMIVEEDLEFVPGTYAYVCAALRRYQNESRVMGVTAWSPIPVRPAGLAGPYFGGRTSSLVWGTYRRAWQGMAEADAAQRLAECVEQGIDPTRYGNDLVFSVRHEHERGFWDFRFNLQMLSRGGLFLWPHVNMIRHTGYEPRATNSPHMQEGWDDVVGAAPDPATIVWPDVAEHPGAARLWRAARDLPSMAPHARAWRWLKRRLAGDAG